MRIFLAGGPGVLGRRAVPMLVAAGHPVTVSGRTPDEFESLVRRGARAAEVDLFDEDEVRRAVADR
jgi:nucleoside-diphosphate-sugar epimerase